MGHGNIFAGGVPRLRDTGTISDDNKSSFIKKQAPPPEPVAAAVPADARELWKVIFDYAPQNDDELELKVGEFVRIESKMDGDGWWEGEMEGTGKKGVFPDNFVAAASSAEVAVRAAPKVRDTVRRERALLSEQRGDIVVAGALHLQSKPAGGALPKPKAPAPAPAPAPEAPKATTAKLPPPGKPAGAKPGETATARNRVV